MITELDKRFSAYHEAGHAAMQFMFGNHNAIVFIDMVGDLNQHAFIRSRESDFTEALTTELPKDIRRILLLQAERRIMCDLAGETAENLAKPLGCPDWLDAYLNAIEYEDGEPLPEITRAINIAKLACGDNGNALRFLRRMAKWTDEALAHSRLWAVVEALAEQLTLVKIRMSGSRACGVMENAWGNPGSLPYMVMGPRWRRRFSMPPKPKKR